MGKIKKEVEKKRQNNMDKNFEHSRYENKYLNQALNILIYLSKVTMNWTPLVFKRPEVTTKKVAKGCSLLPG
jgi:hypothetical protein